MKTSESNINKLKEQIQELKLQLFEARETIEAIRTGQIDALVFSGDNGHELYTLKTADQSYRVFIEKMTEGAATLNREGTIVYANTQFATMVTEDLSHVIGTRFGTYIADENSDIYNSIFENSWRKDLKIEVKLKSGKKFIPVLLSLTTLDLEDGKALSILVTDLTIQKRTQLQLELNNMQLEVVNQALEKSNHDLQQFASVASHDLQEPLRKIQIFSNRLKASTADTLSPAQEKDLNKIIESSQRMKALIVDVLNYSKLSADDNVFELIDIKALLNELIDDFEIMVQEKNAVIHIGEFPQIEANRGQIRQVFQNIVSNALKFIKPHQSPEIFINSKRVKFKSISSDEDANGRYCLITVKDNGIGFDEKYLQNIFTLFERLHSKTAYEGTGIGMAITKKIVDKHHGIIDARSIPGDGATFFVLLPVQQKPEDNEV